VVCYSTSISSGTHLSYAAAAISDDDDSGR
jgi:hypothetical protein